MRIECFEYLLDFAELGSISATAAKNFMSEQGISRIFRQMEKEYGVSLFKKEGKNLFLTDAGLKLVQCAEEVVRGYQRVQDVLGYYAEEEKFGRDDLSVFATPCAALCFLPTIDLLSPSLFPFRVKMREEDLGLFNTISSAIEDKRGLGIITIPPTSSSDAFLAGLEKRGLMFKGLLESEVVALVSSNSPLARQKELVPELYEQGSLGGFGVACPKDDAVLDQLDDVVREDNIRIVTSNMSLIKKQLGRGRVTMLLPKLVLATHEFGSEVTWLPLRESTKVKFGLLLSREYGNDQNVTTLVDYIGNRVLDVFGRDPFNQYAEIVASD